MQVFTKLDLKLQPDWNLVLSGGIPAAAMQKYIHEEGEQTETFTEFASGHA